MPELCRFYGITIRIYYADHHPPHFHAIYGEHTAVVSIETLALIGGELPPRALGLVTEWAARHREELRDAWQKTQNLELPEKIAPLE